MNKLEIVPDTNEDESDIETDSASDKDEQYAKLTKPVYFLCLSSILITQPIIRFIIDFMVSRK